MIIIIIVLILLNGYLIYDCLRIRKSLSSMQKYVNRLSLVAYKNSKWIKDEKVKRDPFFTKINKDEN